MELLREQRENMNISLTVVVLRHLDMTFQFWFVKKSYSRRHFLECRVYGTVGFKIFIVEDDPRVIRAVTDVMGSRGYVLDAPWTDSRLPSVRFGGIRVDFQKSQIVRGAMRIALSERECRLLQFLVLHRGAPVSRDMLLEHVWGYREAPLTRTVDVTIRRLRQKLETNPEHPRFIITVPGVGYRFGR